MIYTTEELLEAVALLAVGCAIPSAQYDAISSIIQAAEPRVLSIEELRQRNRFAAPIWDECLHEWCTVRDGKISYFEGGYRPFQADRFYTSPPKGDA